MARKHCLDIHGNERVGGGCSCRMNEGNPCRLQWLLRMSKCGLCVACGDNEMESLLPRHRAAIDINLPRESIHSIPAKKERGEENQFWKRRDHDGCLSGLSKFKTASGGGSTIFSQFNDASATCTLTILEAAEKNVLLYQMAREKWHAEIFTFSSIVPSFPLHVEIKAS